MKSIGHNPKNWRLRSAFGGLLLVVALVFVACGSPQTGSSSPTSHTPGTTVCTYTGHTDAVSQLAWSPDGTYIASGGPDHTLQVWEARTGKHIRSINVLLNVKSEYGGMTFAWSPDSKSLVAGFSDHTAKVVNVMTGEFTLTYTGHTASVNQVAWSPDGTFIASESSDKTTQVWEARTGTRIHTFEGISAFAWSPDGKYIALGSIGKAGERTGDSDAHVVDATTWRTLLTYMGHAKSYVKDGWFYPQNVMAVVWSPDGTYIASGSSDKTVQVWIAP